jgi:hypothetical protein
MVTVTQIQNGVATFLDTEIIAMLPGWRRFAFGAATGLMLARSGEIFAQMKSNSIVQMMGVIQPDDTVDIDTLYKEAKKQIQKSPLTFDLPGAGTITLRETDIDKLYQKIING